MSSTDSYDTYDPAVLPPVIAAYMIDHRDNNDSELIARAFTPDARVTDEGIEYDGKEGIHAWLNKTTGEYTYTTTFLGQQRDGPHQWTILTHLDGDFPGGTVDLRFRFTLRGDKISGLIIAP